ncbi:MAG: hydroxymethylbilane synthase [Acidimicrobiales bacterium]
MALLRIATRKSPLALWQAEHVASLLRSAHRGLQVELVGVTTTGDKFADAPISEMGGKGAFAHEVEQSVLAGQADAAVHSAKDLPPVAPPGLRLAAVPSRADPRDALVGCLLSELGPGTPVATGSPRRRAQLARIEPGLRFSVLRGNIATRLARIPPGGGVVVALAALARLGLEPEPLDVLSTGVMLPQVGQGALAVECREDDGSCLELFSAIEDPVARQELDAERAFLAVVDGRAAGAETGVTTGVGAPTVARTGGCSLPVAAHATSDGEGLRLEGLLASPDGRALIRQEASGRASVAADLGRAVAEMVLASGGEELLKKAPGA